MGYQCNPVVVKIGGSVITRKDKPMTVNEEMMGRVAEAIAAYYKSRQGSVSMVLIHGGGSYGHYLVERYLSEKGVMGPLESAKVQASMMELSRKFANILLDLGVPVIVHPAHTLCRGMDCDFSRLLDDVLLGAVPMTYGDVILTDLGGRVVSGDTLAVKVATLIRARCLIFVTSVPGLMAPDGRILTTYTGKEKLAEVDSGVVDVTGGMRGKLEAAFEFAKQYPDAIVRIVSPKDLLPALEGGDVGTLIRQWEE